MASIFNENIGKLKYNICVILKLNWYYKGGEQCIRELDEGAVEPRNRIIIP